ncbi:MAG: DsrE family protein [Betaproteobacteria bacterium]|nr:DsrE family protein [Betaproteobacteria bacterium]
MKRMKYLCGLALALGLAAPAAAAPQLEPALSQRTLLNVDPHARYKVVYDIHTAETAAGISKGLFYARGLIEAYRKQGVAPKQLDIHLVLHGEAAQYLLVDTTYRDVVGDPFAVNLNAKITQDLLDLGVSVEICHSVMKSKGWTADDVLPGVTIVHDGYTRIIKLENDGYAYIGGF